MFVSTPILSRKLCFFKQETERASEIYFRRELKIVFRGRACERADWLGLFEATMVVFVKSSDKTIVIEFSAYD